jgi:hypothetical protein
MMFGRLGDNIWDHEMPIRFGGIPAMASNDGDPTYRPGPSCSLSNEARLCHSGKLFKIWVPLLRS